MAAWYDNALFEKWIARFSARLLGTKENDTTVVPRVYDMVDRYFPDSTLGSQDKLVQLAVLNAAYSAFVKTQLEYSQGGASDIAQRKQGGAWMEMARTGARTLIIVRQIAEAIIYFFGAFLPIFIAAAGFGVLTKYIRAIFWLQLWVPIFVLLNAISDFYLLKAIESVSQYSSAGAIGEIVLNFATVDRLRIESGMVVGYLGLLSLSVPAIAWAILKGTDSLGGMVGSIASTNEAGKAGASTATQRAADMSKFSGPGMTDSAWKAGAGMSMGAGMLAAADGPGYGAAQNMSTVNYESALKVDTPRKSGEVNQAIREGAGALAAAGEVAVARNVGTAQGTRDRLESLRKAGTVSNDTTIAEMTRTENLKSDISTATGQLKTWTAPDGKILFSTETGAGKNGAYNVVYGSKGEQVGADRKGEFTIGTGSSAEINQKSDPGAMATLQKGASSGKGIFSVEGSSRDSSIVKTPTGTTEKMDMSKDQVLSELKTAGMEKTPFYGKVSAMKGDSPVTIATERDTARNISNVTATQGGDKRTINGTLTQHAGEVKFDGVDKKTGAKVSSSGTAESVNVRTGEVSGFRTYDEKSSSGKTEHMNVSKSEALSQLAELRGGNFYEGIKAMGKGPISLNIEKDTAGNISNVTATQGGRSSRLDQNDTNAMTTFKQGYDSWTGNKSVREDTDLNVSQHGTKAWSGYQGVTENSNTRTGVFKDIDPETGKEAMFYGRWHSDPATGKQVAADITNINTGRVNTVRTTKDEKGNENKHYGIGTYESGQGGVGKVSNFKELSHDEINKGGFATNRTMGQTGETLLEINKKGQDTSALHRFRYDNSKEFLTSAAAAGLGGKDQTNFSDGEMARIIGIGAVNKGVEMFNQTVTVGRSAKEVQGWRVQKPTWKTNPAKPPAPPAATKTVNAKPKPPRGRGR